MLALADYPEQAGWMDDTVPAVNKRIVLRAFRDVGIHENPPGSNRSGRIDAFCTFAGSPLGSFWCACAVSKWWFDAGATIPAKFKRGSCDEWVKWAIANKRWFKSPVIGAAAIFGTKQPFDAKHIEIVSRLTPFIRTIGGNTGLGAQRNGEAVEHKYLDEKWLLGYIHPVGV